MVDTNVLVRHLHSALRNADDEEARYHIRHALQYLEDAPSNAERTHVDESFPVEGR
jgi:hypothetical protein